MFHSKDRYPLYSTAWSSPSPPPAQARPQPLLRQTAIDTWYTVSTGAASRSGLLQSKDPDCVGAGERAAVSPGYRAQAQVARNPSRSGGLRHTPPPLQSVSLRDSNAMPRLLTRCNCLSQQRLQPWGGSSPCWANAGLWKQPCASVRLEALVGRQAGRQAGVRWWVCRHLFRRAGTCSRFGFAPLPMSRSSGRSAVCEIVPAMCNMLGGLVGRWMGEIE